MKQLFYLQKQLLRLMGHDMRSAKNRDRRIFRHYASLLLVVSAQLPMLSFAYYHRDDITLVTGCLSVAFTNLLTVIKMITFLYYKPHFWQMMYDFNAMHNSSRLAQGRQYITKANQLAIRLSKAYSWSCCFTSLYFMLGPIVKLIRSKIAGTVVVRELPMLMRFPFNYEDSPGYECAFVYVVLVTFSVVTYASAIDGLFISFAINLRAHFQALQNFLCSNDFQQPAWALQRDIGSYVDYHVLLLEMSKQLCVIYMPITFGQFLITSLQVCVIIYQIVTHINSVMSLLVNFSFFSAIMLQLFMYCYGGEIIKHESLQVSTAVQLTDWYKLAPQQRRMLQLMMLRSQRASLIKAGFYEASLANFSTIIRAAVSYITIIQSIE